MSIEEKAKKLHDLGEKYQHSPDKLAEYKANPIETLKKAGLELTKEEYEQIINMPVIMGGNKCCLGC